MNVRDKPLQVTIAVVIGAMFVIIIGRSMVGNVQAVHIPLPLLSVHSYHHYKEYFLWIPVKVNDKAIWMQLDSGSWMSSVTGSDVHKLGLDKLPVSEMASKTNGTETSIDANGQNLTLKAVDANLWVDGSTFKTTVTIDPRISVGPSILSLNDLLQAENYHNIESKLCHTSNSILLLLMYGRLVGVGS
jgi:hypothetical protein